MIGLTDFGHEGKFTWLCDGAEVTDTDWAKVRFMAKSRKPPIEKCDISPHKTEAHGREPSGGTAQQCVAMAVSYQYKWRDVQCHLVSIKHEDALFTT